MSAEKLREFANELSNGELDNERVTRVLKKNIIDLKELEKVVEYSTSHPYGRKILLSEPNLELLLTGWEPSNEVIPHDHGKSDGVVLICKGKAKHKIYSFQEKLELVSQEEVSEGNLLSAPAGAIHSMGNPTSERMFALHIYSPSIQFMNLYESPPINRILTVSGKSGAWLPESKEDLIKSKMICDPLRLVEKETEQKDNLALIQQARDYIENHSLFRHPFFEIFASGKLTNQQVQKWAKQRYFSSRNFPRFLGSFISHIEDDVTRTAYIKQAYEEHGELHLDKIHARQLRQLIYASGVNQEELEKEEMLGGTKQFVDAYWRISKSGDLSRTMGAFALGTEPVVPLEMKLCLRGLKTLPNIEEKDKVYFTDHALHDTRHTIELVRVLLPSLKKPRDYEKALQGMTEIVEARKALYDGIAEFCNL